MKYVYALFSLQLILSCNSNSSKNITRNSNLPNIIIIYTDDLGYGDVSAYGSIDLNTPQIDHLAQNGLMFTNGYAASATCTPSRYALLTGTYPWRNKNAKILPGTAPLLIDTTQTTLPKLLKAKGYTTGIVGKWHLGLGNGTINWNTHIAPGPNEVGFDYSYIMAATQDRVPTVYIKNGDVVNLDKNDPIKVRYDDLFENEPTATTNPELVTMKWHHGHNNTVVNGIPRIGFMKGGHAAKWNDEAMAKTFLKEAQNFIIKEKEHPFFLYYAMQQPHVPRTPSKEFVGKSGLGPRGDVILEADWCIGELINTLTQEHLLENTLIVFTSDNGPILNDGYYDDAVEKNGNHKPSGEFRGGKYSLFEGGTRVPFVLYWKDKISPSKSNAMVSQIDLLSSISALVKSDISTPDSENLLDTFLGQSEKGRNEIVIEASSYTALRQGDWIYIPPTDDFALYTTVNIETGHALVDQLYNIANDIGQKTNLAKTYPDKLKAMKLAYNSIIGNIP